MISRLKPILQTAVMLLVLTTCSNGEESEKPTTLHVLVSSDDGEPLAGAVVGVDGVEAGVTDAQGLVSAVLRGPDGRLIAIDVQCPSGWTPKEGIQRDLRLRHIRPLGKPRGDLSPLESHFECSFSTRSHVLIVHTDGRADLPVMVTGKRVGATDSHGVAQVVIVGAPGDEVLVRLDTGDHPLLRPASPSRRLILPDKSRFLVFDQEFESREKHVKKSIRRKRTSGPKRL
jgi:hypothetical protein